MGPRKPPNLKEILKPNIFPVKGRKVKLVSVSKSGIATVALGSYGYPVKFPLNLRQKRLLGVKI